MKLIRIKKIASAKCEHFKEFMDIQKNTIEKSIDENKWYLSEKAGHDVGWTEAEIDFIITHLNDVAKRFRENFCGKICKFRENCDWKKSF
jgi:hypothetical protein